MNEDINSIPYEVVHDHNYANWFQDYQYSSNVTLTKAEREDLAKMIDETVEQFSEGLPMVYNNLESIKDLHDDYHNIERIFSSVALFAVITMIDSMIATKLFILAEKDYDKRFLRGKLKVILNEGFKRLFGFINTSSFKDSEWARLGSIMKHFPEAIQFQYQKVTVHLTNSALSSSWWKDVRDPETHIQAEKLYKSRMEEIIESEVVRDSLKLFDTFMAVNQFLGEASKCMVNYLLKQRDLGKLKDE
ncbi:MAG: hypothetical protein J6X57_05050 [Bacteroidales bacterium]|nr:hypothetical protein [Bacteroidales bacterium]